MSFAVLTDTSGNLPKRLTDENNIGVIPFTYTVNGEDRVCLDIENFNGADFFEPWLREGKDVIFISMSSGISGSYNSANIAAGLLRESYPERRVRPIDTRGAALGEGLVALQAAACRDRGMSFEETVAAMERLSTRMCNVFTVDDLMFLRRGGRLSNLSAIVGTVLNIKPLLKGNEEGKIVAFAKLRGRKRSIEALAEKYEMLAVAPETQTIGVVNAACRQDADRLIELLKRKCPPKEIIDVDYEPVTGCHVGPGALALFFVGPDDVRTAVDGETVTERIGDLIQSVRERVQGKD